MDKKRKKGTFQQPRGKLLYGFTGEIVEKNQSQQKKAKLDSPRKLIPAFEEDDVVPKDTLHKLLKNAGMKFGRNGALALGNALNRITLFSIILF